MLAGTNWPGTTVNEPLDAMMEARCRMWDQAWVVRYRSMVSERHRPTSCITSGSILPQRRAIAPPALVERADTSSGRKPMDGPIIAADTLIVAVTKAAVTEHHLLWAVLVGQKTAHKGVEGDAWWRRRCTMRRMTTSTGQPSECWERACPITSSRVPFFCVVNVRVTKVASNSMTVEHVRMSRRMSLMKSCTSHRRNGWLSVDTQYSPGRNKKKKAR
jgi:hypothetical protein